MSFGDLGKELGSTWGEMSDEDKKPYAAMAVQDKERHATDKAAVSCPRTQLRTLLPCARPKPRVSRCSAPTIHSGLNAISYLCVAKLSKLPEARLASPLCPRPCTRVQFGLVCVCVCVCVCRVRAQWENENPEEAEAMQKQKVEASTNRRATNKEKAVSLAAFTPI